MNLRKQKLPPAWANSLLRWYCKEELIEDLEGDLHEFFDRNIETKGVTRAKIIYVADVFKFCRLYTIRKPKFLNILIQWLMLGSYIKTSGRNILRNKLFSSINIIGLAISMSVGLLMIGMLMDLASYDDFHKNGSRIYRVVSQYQYKGMPNENLMATTSLPIGRTIKETISGIDKEVIMRNGLYAADIKFEQKVIPLNGLYADENFFSVFTFPLSAGNEMSALKNPFSLVLTESSARKLFGTINPLGKIVTMENNDYTITGVMKDVPAFSHMRFEMLASLSTRDITEKGSDREFKWENVWSNYVYIVIPENTDLKVLQNKLDIMCASENKALKDIKILLSLQPLTKIALGKELNNSIGPVMRGDVVWVVGIMAFVVIISACFNYTNLSIAKSLRRSREVGIRKVVGARSSNVLSQFVVEAVVIALLSLMLAFILFILLKPYFLTIDPKLADMLSLKITPTLILYFLMMALVVGLLAGFAPAIFFANLSAVKVLKDASAAWGFGNINVRKILIVLQYTISLIFITSTIISYRQYKHFLLFDLGFKTDGVLNIYLHNNKPEGLIHELSQLPEVSGISKSQMIPGVGTYYGTLMNYQADSIGIFYNNIDHNYLPLHEHKLLAGRNFLAKSDSAVADEVIVNEEVLKHFNIKDKDPEKALGEVVKINHEPMTIVGVMKNSYYGRADQKEMPRVVFRNISKDATYLNVKIASADWTETLQKIDRIWKKFDEVHTLDAKFYDEEIAQAYGEISAMLKITGFLAFLAICIASLGLLGMVVFITETRMKEISIRKVLGASEGDLIYLLSKGFLLLLAIAALIGIPATYFVFDKYILSAMNNHAPIGALELSAGLAGVVTLAFLLIGSQTLKVARSNPASVLKSE